MVENNYGLLVNKTAKIHRQYFNEMVRLLGINVLYRAPLPNKHWTNYAEIDSNYAQPIVIGCIFDDHPNQYTMKKLGWVSELQESASLISVPYDTPGIQVGVLFEIPGGLDNSERRLFRAVSIYNSMIYPSSITCQIVPEYIDTFEKSLYDHSKVGLNLLKEEGDGNL